MSKLYQLLDWVTPAEAASFLTRELAEPVSEADVFRLAADGKLRISINFVNGAHGVMGQVLPPRQADLHDVQETEVPHARGTLLADDSRFRPFADYVQTIGGVWDLAMVWAEHLLVESEYQQRVNGVAVDLARVSGIFVRQGDLWCHLREPEPFSKSVDGAWVPASRLPKGSAFVVKTNALRDIVTPSDLRQPYATQDEPLNRKQLTSLLVILAALCRKAQIPIDGKYKAAGVIAALTQEIGAPVAVNTIAGYLKEVPDALERREAR